MQKLPNPTLNPLPPPLPPVDCCPLISVITITSAWIREATPSPPTFPSYKCPPPFLTSPSSSPSLSPMAAIVLHRRRPATLLPPRFHPATQNVRKEVFYSPEHVAPRIPDPVSRIWKFSLVTSPVSTSTPLRNSSFLHFVFLRHPVLATNTPTMSTHFQPLINNNLQDGLLLSPLKLLEEAALDLVYNVKLNPSPILAGVCSRVLCHRLHSGHLQSSGNPKTGAPRSSLILGSFCVISSGCFARYR